MWDFKSNTVFSVGIEKKNFSNQYEFVALKHSIQSEMKELNVDLKYHTIDVYVGMEGFSEINLQISIIQMKTASQHREDFKDHTMRKLELSRNKYIDSPNKKIPSLNTFRIEHDNEISNLKNTIRQISKQFKFGEVMNENTITYDFIS